MKHNNCAECKDVTNIFQLDGNVTVNTDSKSDCVAKDVMNDISIDDTDENSTDISFIDNNNSISEIPTEDEIEPDIMPIKIEPATKPNKAKMKVLKASSLPLVTVLNARSLYNKK